MLVNPITEIPIITTDRFTLRPFRRPDAESLERNINNPQVARRVSNIPYPYTAGHARAWIDLMEKERARLPHAQRIDFVIDIDGEVAGSVAFINIDGHKAQVSYWLGESYWGRGIVTTAVKELVKFGFETLELVRIYAYTYHHNKASMKVLEKAGFEFEGVHKKEWLKDGTFYDSHFYAIVK